MAIGDVIDVLAVAERVLADPARQAVSLSVHETVALAAAVKWPGARIGRDADGLVLIVPGDRQANTIDRTDNQETDDGSRHS